MLFRYKAIDKNGGERAGVIDALNMEVAISSLQNRNLIVASIEPAEKTSMLRKIPFFNRVSIKDVVIVSRQMATLFEAQVSALRIFRLLSAETSNLVLKQSLQKIADDLQEGSSISDALARHPHIFSNFYISMVKVGEESGKLGDVFVYLADYLDRTYALTSKAKHALVYPIFVIIAFIAVIVLLLTVIIPKLTPILLESGVELPIQTKIIIGTSDFLVHYGVFLLIGIGILIFFGTNYLKTEKGGIAMSNIKLSIPYIKDLYRKLYLTRISDNLNTMIGSGISILQALESTAAVVDNDIYEAILKESALEVKGGKALSDAFSKYEDIPSIMTQMVKVGEETGELGSILKTLAKFYEREVNQAVETLVDLIQPLIIAAIGLGVGFLLAAVLLPIYNIAGSF